MLIGFKLENFRSFASEQTLSYATSPDREHEATHCIRTGLRAVPRLSKSALLFGANASGKSNVLLALATLRDMVLRSTAFGPEEFAERYTPFRFDLGANAPTQFEIDLLLEGVRYLYRIAYNSERVTRERLLVYRTGKSQRWFERRYDEEQQGDVWMPFSPSFTGAREMWRKATRPTALFLTTASQLNSAQLLRLFGWFEQGVEIVFRNDAADLQRLATRVRDPEFRARALNLFRSADICIADIRVHDPGERSGIASSAPSGPQSMRGGARPHIEFLHSPRGRTPVWLQSPFEAAGTHRLLALLGPLLSTIDHGKLLVIDGFDSNLHPLLARFLIKMINDPAVANHSQILFTSHNISLMDLDILRRDEIWLVKLDDYEASTLSTVLRSRPRKHAMIGKGYLRGDYGAVPNIRAELLLLVGKPRAKSPRASGKAREAS